MPTNPPKVNQLAKILPSAWDANSSVHYSKLTDSVNTLLGYNGAIPMVNILDLNGNPVQNVADPTAPQDALNLQTADKNYSPAVTKGQFDVGGKHALKGLTYLYLQTYVNKLIAGAGISLSPTSGTGEVTITASLHSPLPVYANNAAAILGGLVVGDFYRTGADPDPVCVVH